MKRFMLGITTIKWKNSVGTRFRERGEGEEMPVIFHQVSGSMHELITVQCQLLQGIKAIEMRNTSPTKEKMKKKKKKKKRGNNNDG